MCNKRKCYLCNYEYNKNTTIALHRFPNKSLHTAYHKRWLDVCGLNEKDDVSHIYVCTQHFNSTDFNITNKRIKLHHGAVPSIALINPVKASNFSPVSSENNLKNIVSDVCKNNMETMASITLTTANSITVDDEIKMLSRNNNIETMNTAEHIVLDNICTKSIETVASVIPTTAISITVDGEIKVLSRNNIDLHEVQLNPQKERRFTQPRYISEIQLLDVATPLRAKRTLNFIKATDEKKSKEIKRLKTANWKLNKRIVSLKRMMSHLRQKGMVSKDTDVEDTED